MIQILLFLASFASPFTNAAEPSGQLTLTSSKEQTHLIELYSSEGCSSCPPADRWVAGLRTNSKLWQSFVPINFHVDYWNKLGWVDRFSHQSFTQRQYNYANEWGARTVYTPGFVLNGRDWKLKSPKEYEQKSKDVGVLTATVDQKSLSLKVKFSPLDKNQKNYRVYAAILGNGLKTNVTKGENAGEKLEHEFVVLGMSNTNLSPAGSDKSTFTADFTLPKAQITPKTTSVAVWVSGPESLTPIQAVGGDFKSK